MNNPRLLIPITDPAQTLQYEGFKQMLLSISERKTRGHWLNVIILICRLKKYGTVPQYFNDTNNRSHDLYFVDPSCSLLIQRGNLQGVAN